MDAYSLGVCWLDLPSLVILLVMIVAYIVHVVHYNKRKRDFFKKNDKY